jgi:hypothetical protein
VGAGTILGRRGSAALAARERGHEYSPFEARSPRRVVAGARSLDGKGSHALVALLLPSSRTHTKPGSALVFLRMSGAQLVSTAPGVAGVLPWAT